jgi:hypothetical protein
MRALVVIGVLALAPPAGAAELLVVGRSGTLFGPHAVKAKRARAHGCRVGARTPLAALIASGLKVKVRDYGACAPGGLYVRSVAGQGERGRDGWVYKRGHDTPSVGAADPSQRTRGRVLWFWCKNGRHGCQRTLEAVPRRDAGGGVRVTVTAYDDNGNPIAAAGATVRCGKARATADAAGVATFASGCRRVVATQDGRVRSFGERVR